MAIYMSSILLFVIVAAVSTILIGNSKQNKEGNPDYERRTSGNWVRLTSFYVIAGLLGIAILLYVIL